MDLFDPKIVQQVVRSNGSIVTERQYAVPRNVIVWACFEVERQNDPHSYIPNMLDAWYYAKQLAWGKDYPNIADILTIAYLIKPELNVRGVRKVNVSVGYNQKMDWHGVPRALTNLVEMGKDLSPTDWYREFEEIHPFQDGNGRTGSILWNWLRGTLEDPHYPPDVFNAEFWNQVYHGDDTFDN
jgi:hypothetical protein